MPRTNTAAKPVRSFRLSQEGVRQLKDLAANMERSESDVLEVALDRMYREEVRFNRQLSEAAAPEDLYQVNAEKKENE
jgi:DNA-binding PadR family transcriptional regulator